MFKASLGLLKNELRGLGFSRDLVTEAGSLFSASGRRLVSVTVLCAVGVNRDLTGTMQGNGDIRKTLLPQRTAVPGCGYATLSGTVKHPLLRRPSHITAPHPSFPCAKSFQRQWEMIVCSEFFPPIHVTKLKHLMITFLLKTICYFKASEWMILYLFFLRILACFSLF